MFGPIVVCRNAPGGNLTRHRQKFISAIAENIAK